MVTNDALLVYADDIESDIEQHLQALPRLTHRPHAHNVALGWVMELLSSLQVLVDSHNMSNGTNMQVRFNAEDIIDMTLPNHTPVTSAERHADAEAVAAVLGTDLRPKPRALYASLHQLLEQESRRLDQREASDPSMGR